MPSSRRDLQGPDKARKRDIPLRVDLHVDKTLEDLMRLEAEILSIRADSSVQGDPPKAPVPSKGPVRPSVSKTEGPEKAKDVLSKSDPEGSAVQPLSRVDDDPHAETQTPLPSVSGPVPNPLPEEVEVDSDTPFDWEPLLEGARRYGLLALAFLGASLLFWLWSGGAEVHSMRLAVDDPAGLLRRGKTWMVIDRRLQSMRWFFFGKGEQGRGRPFPNLYPTGLASGQGGLWSLEGSRQKILFHDEGQFGIQAEYSAPGPYPAGIGWQDGLLWVGDRSLRRLFRMGRESEGALKVVDEWPLPVGLLVSLAPAKNGVWVLDGVGPSLRFFEFRESGVLETRPPVSLRDSFGAGARPESLVVEEDAFWVLGSGPAKLLKINRN